MRKRARRLTDSSRLAGMSKQRDIRLIRVNALGLYPASDRCNRRVADSHNG